YADVDGRYTGGDGQVHREDGFTKRTIFSGWDVFRSQMPLQTIINPRLVSDMINSLITLADQSGNNYLPRWELLNAYTGCMIGNPAVSMIADAYMKGIRTYDIGKAYKYSLGTVQKTDNGPKGYTTGGLSISETLEYAYADWCLSVLARELDKPADAKLYGAKALDYKNVFDTEKGWFRPRNEDGSWQPWPKEGRLTQNYGTIESNPYQQGWFVPQDIEGMVRLMGGRQKVKNDLISMFDHTPKNFMWNDYYNHANEPVHHIPFLFNRVGAPWLTQQWTRKICSGAYKNKVEGLVGNEDVGQMSAWYVLAAAGIHPICPGDPRYEITSPVFSKVTLQLMAPYAKGKSFTIIAKNNSEKNVYIQSAKLNGKTYNKCYLMHAAIAAGGRLELIMGPKPNLDWGLEK
ncbi:MAG TPA: glycoside hydrolase family 92 protein, partial [Arachidicoccus sp.]|nr:glycoside hydrolase family 92 protein [Arachidicoccus sp.]